MSLVVLAATCLRRRSFRFECPHEAFVSQSFVNSYFIMQRGAGRHFSVSISVFVFHTQIISNKQYFTSATLLFGASLICWVQCKGANRVVMLLLLYIENNCMRNYVFSCRVTDFLFHKHLFLLVFQVILQ